MIPPASGNLRCLIFSIAIVFSFIYGFAGESENRVNYHVWNRRHLLSANECSKQNITFGRRQKWDVLVNSTLLVVEKKFFRKSCFYLKYDRKFKRPNNTTFIEVINKNRECNCYSNKVQLVDGGINKRYANLYFKSESSCGLYYLIKFYAN